MSGFGILFSTGRIGVVTLLMSALAGGWLMLRQHDIRVAENLGTKQRLEAVAVWQAVPAPSAENEAALQQDLVTIENTLRSWRNDLGPRDGPDAGDTYFTLAADIAAWRTRAAQAGVAFRPDERFGFSSYVETGPTESTAFVVRRQRLAVAPVLMALFAAQPTQLHSVRRENPELGQAAEVEAGEDFFQKIQSGARSRSTVIASESLRFEFTGTTQTLRLFLNALATLKPLTVVRELAVEPSATPGQPLAIGSPMSRFTVVVECVVSATRSGGRGAP